MRKSIIIQIVILFAVNSFNNASVQRNLKDEDINGKARVIRTIEYNAKTKFGEIVKGNVKTKYNAKNRQVFYDENGNCIKLKAYMGEVLTFYKIYFYNSNGQIKESREFEIVSDDEKLREKTIYKYNTQNNLIEKNRYLGNGQFMDKISYEYDENDNLIKKTKTFSTGTISSEEFTKYNDQNQKIEIISYDHERDYQTNEIEKKLESKSVYKYDKNENLTKSIFNYFPRNIKSTKTFNYNNEGYLINKTEERKVKGAVKSSKITSYSYDTAGNILNEKLITQNSTIITKYVYDKNDNWVQKIKIVNSDPKSIIERKIKYWN
ncbi:MAG: hypothetical protein ACOCP4_04785 [Candidatus Woesearchaeota archaeon]